MRTCMVLFLMAAGLGGCCNTYNVERLEDDSANVLLTACCNEARERVEIVKDIESDKFRKRCAACKHGNTMGECESAAKAVQQTVKEAYASDLWPISCTTMRQSLADQGIEIPNVR